MTPFTDGQVLDTVTPRHASKTDGDARRSKSEGQGRADLEPSKTDFRARPMFVRTRDPIEAHLTVVFTALP